MSAEYYAAGPEARAVVNRLLDLPPEPTQDWEFILADPARIEEMLDLIARRELGLEPRSALAQLLVASIDAAESDEVLSSASVLRAEAYFATDPEVRERMVFFWLNERRGRHAHAVAFALGRDPAPLEPYED